MTWPLTVPVTRHRVTRGAVDDLGNDTTTVEDTEVMVFAAWVPSSDEQLLAGHDRVLVDAKLAAPIDAFRDDDEATVDTIGGRFVVDGRPENYEANPWWSPGLEIVNLRRIHGA